MTLVVGTIMSRKLFLGSRGIASVTNECDYFTSPSAI